MDSHIPFEILPQPDDSTCGPTCLHAIYRYHGVEVPLEELARDIPRVDNGGTLGVFLANDALRRGFKATIYTYNLLLFDPTWFASGKIDIADRLRRQAAAKPLPKLQQATQGYLEFMELGGRLRFEDLRPRLIRRFLRKSLPIITGLSATYLYRTPRENAATFFYDDVHGEPSGHFVVLCGHSKVSRLIRVADPHHPNPVFDTPIYEVSMDRVISSILLGIVTYDANLIVIEPRKSASKK